MEKGPFEIRYKSTSEYMSTYAPLTYLTIGLLGLGFIQFQLILFAGLPAIYLLRQRSEFNKKAGKVALIISSDGIESRWGQLDWKHLNNIKLEKSWWKFELSFAQQIDAGNEKFFRYSLNELDIHSEELYHYIAMQYNIEITGKR